MRNSPDDLDKLKMLWEQRFDQAPQIGTTLVKPPPEPAWSYTNGQRLAEQQRWAIAYAPGRWYFSGTLLDLFDDLRGRCAAVARALDFDRFRFPRCLERETAEQFGLPEIFPQTLVQFQGGRGHGGFLDPVQCAPFYPLLDHHLASGQPLPLKVFEDGGESFRDEESRLETFATAREFLRSEFVFAAPPAQIDEIRSRLIESLAGMFSGLGLRWRAVAGSGCSDHPHVQDHPAPPGPLPGKAIPVIDLEVEIAPGNWLECAGATLHYSRKTRREHLWSSCAGVGLNRLAYAYLCRHGTAERTGS